MATYTVDLGPDHEDALSWYLEQIAQHAAASEGPFAVPTRQHLVTDAARGGLVAPYSQLQGQGEQLVTLLKGLDQTTRTALLAQMASAALRSFVTRRLAQEG